MAAIRELSSIHGKMGNTSFLKTVFNGINALTGIGFIIIPYTLSKLGWLGLGLILVMAAINCYTGWLLTKCLDSKPTFKIYSDIAFAAFGQKGKIIISFLFCLELFLIPTSFLVLEGDNLHRLFPNLGYQFKSFHIKGNQLFTMITALVVLPSLWLKNLNLLSFISASGILSYLLIIGCILWTGALEGVGFSAKGKLFDFTGIPTAISYYAFCFGAHPIFPTLYLSMKERNKFPKVLMISFTISSLCYISIGIMGYLMYGEQVLPEIVTLNLPANKTSSKIAIYTLLVGPITKYALIITPLSEAIENYLPRTYNCRFSSIITKTVLLISTTIVAVVFPFLGILIAMVGALLNVNISIIIPCIFYLKICCTRSWKSFEVVMIIGIIIMAVVGAGLGTYSALRDAIKAKN